MAARSTFDPSIAEQIVAGVASGKYPAHVFQQVGVPKRTVHSWLKMGRDYDRAIEAEETPKPEHEPHAKFSRRYDKAKGEAVNGIIDKLDACDTPIWKKWAWRAGKLAPNVYGDREKMNPLDKRIADGQKMRDAIDNLSEDARKKLAEAGEQIADEIGGAT